MKKKIRKIKKYLVSISPKTDLSTISTIWGFGLRYLPEGIHLS